ncbi:MAG: hypothetical protein U1F50_11695 [Rubrivivax sp.]
MSKMHGSRWITLAVWAAMAAFAALVIADLRAAPARPAPYWIADWQINYAAGFVRRGLLGEIVRVLGPRAGVDSRTAVLALQVLAYLCFFGCLGMLLPPLLRRHPRLAFMAFSPIAFSFKPLDLEPGSTGAKEIVLFAALALQVLIVRHRKAEAGAGHAGLVLTAIAWTLLVLVHESFFFFLPFSLLVILLGEGRSIRLPTLVMLALPATLAFLASARFHGDASFTAVICDSLGAAAPEGCRQAGAIAWISRTPGFALKAIYYQSVTPPYLPLTTLQVLALGCAGLAVLWTDRQVVSSWHAGVRDRTVRWAAGAGLLLPLPLLLVFSDQGRLLNMWFTCAALALLALLGRQAQDPAASKTVADAGAPRVGSGARVMWGLLFAAYTTLWSSHGPCCADRLGQGFFGALYIKATERL